MIRKRVPRLGPSWAASWDVVPPELIGTWCPDLFWSFHKRETEKKKESHVMRGFGCANASKSEPWKQKVSKVGFRRNRVSNLAVFREVRK